MIPPWEATLELNPVEVSKNTLRWVNYEGNLAVRSQEMTAFNRHLDQNYVDDVLSGSERADMNLLTDPNKFLGGQLHKHYGQWLHIAASIHQELTRDVLD